MDQLAVTDDGDAPDHLVGATRQARDELARLVGVRRLAEDVAVEADVRVRAEHEPARHLGRDRQRLAARILLGDPDRIARGLLLDVRDVDGEGDADLLEDRAPLGRAAPED